MPCPGMESAPCEMMKQVKEKPWGDPLRLDRLYGAKAAKLTGTAPCPLLGENQKIVCPIPLDETLAG